MTKTFIFQYFNDLKNFIVKKHIVSYELINKVALIT